MDQRQAVGDIAQRRTCLCPAGDSTEGAAVQDGGPAPALHSLAHCRLGQLEGVRIRLSADGVLAKKPGPGPVFLNL